MAIIENLSLRSGGGIISSASQCEQREDTVSLFIGLGGAGTDAIRSIKMQVNECLIPDNACEYNDPKSEVAVREYRHIRFFSIDTDRRSSEGGQIGFDVLDITEKMDLFLTGRVGRIDTTDRPDLSWIKQYDYSISSILPRSEPAGGIRQAGRYLLFEKIDYLQEMIKGIIDSAMVGLSDDCNVIINLFSGLCGGTGSGIFLDVSYAIKNVIKNYKQAFVIGYFFMPDISLSKPGLDQATKRFIPMNGYAALQELNYCMSIPDNGGAFRQIIKDGSYIDWKQPPVDLCYLISAKNEKNETISDDAYNYAMRTVTDFVMYFLTKNDYHMFDTYAYYSNQRVRTKIASDKRTGGYNPCMLSLGAASASISNREFNTYLACGMFEEYRKVHNETVQQIDAEDAINKAWNVTSLPLTTMVEKIYASLLQKLTGNDTTGLQGYDYYQDPDGLGKPWKFLLETVNSNGENELEAVYQQALNNHIGNLAANADKLISTGVDGVDNKESLIYLLDQALDPIVKDINRGPKFAKNIIDHVEGVNVLNLIQGLKAKNNAEYQAKEKDRTLRYEDYLETKRIFFNQEKQGMFDSDKKRYEDFENCVIAYVQLIEQVGGVYSSNPNARPLVGVYAHITNILDTLEKQIRDRVANYYAPLCDTLSDLTDTFEANYSELINKSTSGQKLGFNNPLIAINDPNIIALLDAQIKGISMPNTFRLFMEAMTAAGYDVWQKKETRLPKTVQSFFVGRPGGVFAGFAGMTVDNFLEKKYGLVGQNLEQQIIKDYVNELKNASTPLLSVDISKCDDQYYHRNLVAYPRFSSVIANAMQAANSGISGEWTQIPSSISDRLLFVQIRDGFPLQAYTSCSDLENDYFRSAVSDATHLYEENGIYPDIKFSDWRALPTITAPSVVDPNAPDAIKSKIDSVKELFDKAVNYGIIKLNVPYDEAKEEEYCFLFSIPESLPAEIDSLNDSINDTRSVNQLAKIKARIADLIKGWSENLTKTDIRLKQQRYSMYDNEFDHILKLDFLYFAPVYQINVRETIDRIEENIEKLKRLTVLIGKRTRELEEYYRKDYYLALYTGVLQINDDGSIVFEHKEIGTVKQYTLSAYGKNFKYEEIPFYQAYISFLDLDEAIQKEIHILAREYLSVNIKRYASAINANQLGDAEISKMMGFAKMLYEPDTVDIIEKHLLSLKEFFDSFRIPDCKGSFLQALYTGVLQIKDDASIVYVNETDGIPQTYVLFAYGEYMMFEEIPYYQAFVSYLELDDQIQDNISKSTGAIIDLDDTQQYAKTLKKTVFGDSELDLLRIKAKMQYPDRFEEISRFLEDLESFVL